MYNTYANNMPKEQTCQIGAFILFLDVVRGCFIISVKAQVGVFLFKLFIMKREHSGGYVTDE